MVPSLARDGGAEVSLDEWIVYPDQAGTGLRHVVLHGGSRTLCGIDADDWYLETKRFDAATIGCKRCKKGYRTSITIDPSATAAGGERGE